MKKRIKLITLGMLVLSTISLSACSNNKNANSNSNNSVTKQSKTLPKADFAQNSTKEAQLAQQTIIKAQKASYDSFYLGDITAVKNGKKQSLTQTLIKISGDNYSAEVNNASGIKMKDYCINGYEYIQLKPSNNQYAKRKAKTHKTITNTRETIKSMYNNFKVPNIVNEAKVNTTADKIIVTIPNSKKIRNLLTQNIQVNGRKIVVDKAKFKLISHKNGTPISVNEQLKITDKTPNKAGKVANNSETLSISIKDINSSKIKHELSKVPKNIQVVQKVK